MISGHVRPHPCLEIAQSIRVLMGVAAGHGRLNGSGGTIRSDGGDNGGNLGLDLDRVREDMKLPAMTELIRQDLEDVKTLKVSEPPKRSAGVKVADVAALVDKLKNEAKVI